MKKVCIVTWSKSTNYGTCFQAYALYRYIKSLGYDVCILKMFRAPYHIKCVLNWIHLKQKSIILIVKDMNKKSKNNINVSKSNKLEKFENNFTYLSIRNRKSWNAIKNDFITFISGGDQIWNPNYISRSSLLDFLYHEDNIGKISYGTSIGVSEIPSRLRKVYSTFWKEYDSIGVREKQAAEMVERISNKKATVVVDPVFLLSKNEWIDFAGISDYNKKIPKEYIFCYFVDIKKFYMNFSNKIRKKTGYQLVIISLEGKVEGDYVMEDAGPEEFILLLMNASLVITDSYHGIVLSLIFNKNFYVLKRFLESSVKSENSRIHEILDEYGLQNRLVDNVHFDISEKIDFEDTNNKIIKNVVESKTFLKNNLDILQVKNG